MTDFRERLKEKQEAEQAATAFRAIGGIMRAVGWIAEPLKGTTPDEYDIVVEALAEGNEHEQAVAETLRRVRKVFTDAGI